ncbi:hypothetical protein NQ318_005281 [Aromia moschata]|uniref:Uncharacterized protein n=1 Tax=Aromia moschata TaxID=1265417 RepID=A0AAV8Y284_9CUCU|nr:hypothetical protein NQ318_005281 [Aromia moschata]
MSAHIICVTSGGGLPIFSRKKGNSDSLPFSIVGSLNGVHMFGRPLNIEVLNCLTDDYSVAWREFEESLVIIGIASGCSIDVLNKLLESVFNAIVLIVGIEETRWTAEIQVNKHSSDIAGFVETILCPENHLIQIVLDSFTECVDSMFSCVLISGKVAAATENWWSLHPDEISLLSLLASSENPTNSKDIPVFLPYKSPTVAFRFVACTLIPEVQLCCLCGPTPILNDIEHSVLQCFKNSHGHIKCSSPVLSRNFPASYCIDGGILGLLLINTTSGKYMISKNPQQNSKSPRAVPTAWTSFVPFSIGP